MKFIFIIILSLTNIWTYSQSQIQNGENHKKEFTISQPSFPGGQDSLNAFIRKNLRWPAPDWDGEGIARVQLTISSKGDIDSIKIQKSLGDECDIEVLRLIKLMPKWKPALSSDKRNIAGEVTVPILFRMDPAY